MNKTALALLVISIACVLYSCFRESFSEERKIAFQIIHEASNDYEKKYGLHCCGVHEAGPEGKYEYLGLYLECGKVLTRDEGRKMIVECHDDFLQKINTNENFKQHMRDYPFTEENVGMTIFIRPKNQPLVCYPDIGAYSIDSEKVAFITYPPDYFSGGRSSYDDTEPLEQARNTVKKISKPISIKPDI